MAEQHTDIQSLILKLLSDSGIQTDVYQWQYALSAILLLIGVSIIAHIITRILLNFKIARLISFTKNKWDDHLLHHGVFRRLAHLVPGLVMYAGKYLILPSDSTVFSALSILVGIYLVFAIYMALQAGLNAGEAIYSESKLAKKAPITGFVQVARLLFTLAMVFLVISILMDKSPIYLLSGLTAVAAVLLLIFRDTILGFVAGIQIAANRMFNTGDWIEIPKYGIDGDITQIGLTVVRVQNFDKTISTIPTHALTSEAVKNWRGMQEAGGRRIKRAIHIDVMSIKFASIEELQQWRKLDLISTYLQDKDEQLQNDVKRCENASIDLVNSRKLTNIGTFRAYMAAYLEKHEDISNVMTQMVRQLPPSEIGLPLEIYCFTNETDWGVYEHIQAEIFDHLLAVLPTFGLKTYQRVTNNGTFGINEK